MSASPRRAFGEVKLAAGQHRAASGDSWAEQFLAVELYKDVPAEIRDMWEVVRGVAPLPFTAGSTTRCTRSQNTSYGVSRT
jgi:hypothetical protein